MKTLLFSQSYYLFSLLSLVVFLLATKVKKGRYIILFLYIITIAFLAYFYRIPDRRCGANHTDIENKANKDNITSPADGTIMNIYQREDGKKVITIFLSIFDVHVQYIPYSGQIVDRKYKKGSFHPAFMFKKSERNEKSMIKINTDRGVIEVDQIAGLVASRIVTDPQIGDQVRRGDIYGMIKLSSRVDLTLPENVEILVKEGDKVTGCETVMAKFI